MDDSEAVSIVCQYCGHSFISTFRRQVESNEKYCSDSCRDDAENPEPPFNPYDYI